MAARPFVKLFFQTEQQYLPDYFGTVCAGQVTIIIFFLAMAQQLVGQGLLIIED